MFPRILKRLRELVRIKQYVMTLHAEEEMDEDGLSIFDVENCLLSGEALERQKDQATAEWKYLVRGGTLDESKQIVVVAKLGPTGKSTTTRKAGGLMKAPRRGLHRAEGG